MNSNKDKDALETSVASQSMMGLVKGLTPFLYISISFFLVNRLNILHTYTLAISNLGTRLAKLIHNKYVT